MKKFSSLLAATLLAAAIGNVYAATVNPCPDLPILRDIGSTFTHAFRYTGKQADVWTITADPFKFGKDTWQTVYVAKMPGIDDPQKAVEKAQHDYNYSILMTRPEFSVSESGKLISCRYSPDGNYLVYADNQVLAGLK